MENQDNSTNNEMIPMRCRFGDKCYKKSDCMFMHTEQQQGSSIRNDGTNYEDMPPLEVLVGEGREVRFIDRGLGRHSQSVRGKN
jgi:hypothetical protein